ncbi:hypothetical protein ASC97_15440 [Rhizobium sp. Root1203]|uniref:hypothetical protein n=1 Tax=Rhizobium sp. Root1203 TaxID=1736427 RepID=UPI0007097BD8|nr:hypothetical protein [Rhizobium sp. Root1203]KQV11314.1 hypothetical protein ASC97_15440 [Rhizobium sp. Root1203]
MSLARYYRDLATLAAEACDKFEASQPKPNADVLLDFYDEVATSMINSLRHVLETTSATRKKMAAGDVAADPLRLH